MYDIIKTRQTPHVEPFAGMYLRATGNGQQLRKVHTYNSTTREGTVISYGRLGYGRIIFAKQIYIRPFTAHPGCSGNDWMVTVPNSGWNQGWAYYPIDIYSVHPTPDTAYLQGVRSAKAALKGPKYMRHSSHASFRTLKYITEYYTLKRIWGCPYKYEIPLVAAWFHGYNSIQPE
jgi:hypothetical protein